MSQQLFNALDQDKDGSITRADLESACTTYNVRKNLAEMWTDAAGTASSVDFNKFVTMIDSRMTGFVSRDTLVQALYTLDRNEGRDAIVGGGKGPRADTGVLDADTLEDLLKKAGDKLSTAECEEFFSALNISAAGGVRIDDIIALLLESA